MISQLQRMDAEDDLFDAKVTVLGEQINHHVQEEEGEMFPEATKAKVDMAELGALMAARKQELTTEMGADVDDDVPPRKSPASKKRAEARR